MAIEVKRQASESSSSLLRRFSRRVQGSGTLRAVRGLQYQTRPASPLRKKTSALKRLAKRSEIEHLKKLGKLPDARDKKSR